MMVKEPLVCLCGHVCGISNGFSSDNRVDLFTMDILFLNCFFFMSIFVLEY